MTHLIYLVSLSAALCCMALIDYRYHLAFFYDKLQAGKTIAGAVLFFVLWDAAGIGLHIFYEGSDKYRSGIMLAPHFPLEELFFLTLLCYTTLIGYRYLEERTHV